MMFVKLVGDVCESLSYKQYVVKNQNFCNSSLRPDLKLWEFK